jgi:hypothetical protein
MTGAISTLQNLQNGDIQTFQDIQTNFDTLDTTVSGKVNKSGDTMTGDLVFGTGAKIKYSDSTVAGYVMTSDSQGNITLQQASSSGSGGYDSISYDAPTTTTTILDTTKLTTLKFSGDNSIQSTAFTSAKDSSLSGALTDISDLQTDNTTNQTNISTLQTDVSSLTSTVSGKQDVINSSNKLASSNVDYSSSALQYIDSGITQNLSTSLSGLSSSISALQSSDTTQTNNISTLSSSLASLQSGKQDLISSNNKISSLNVSYGVSSDVSSTLDSINTSLSEKASLSGATFTGDVTAPNFVGTISNATNASKVNVVSNTTFNFTNFVGFVTATSGNQQTYVSSNLGYNPSTQTLSSTNFSGDNFNGNASTSSRVNVATTTGNGSYYPVFQANNLTGNYDSFKSGNFTMNPSTGVMSLTKLKYPSGTVGQVPISDGTGLLTLGTPSSSITFANNATWTTASGATPALTNGAYFNAGSLVLSPGTWAINVNLQLGQPSGSITSSFIRTALSPNTSTGSIFYYQDGYNNAGTPNFPSLTTIVTPTGSTTYTLFIYVSWVGSATWTAVGEKRSFYAIKLA